MPKLKFVLTDDDGRQFEGEVILAAGGTARSASPKRAQKTATETPDAAPSTADFNFESHPRAFMKKHGAGLSGPKQFTLLLAHLVGGKPKIDHDLGSVAAAWERNKGVMAGDYAAVYVTRAKEQGWVNSAQRGSVHLTQAWRDALVT